MDLSQKASLQDFVKCQENQATLDQHKVDSVERSIPQTKFLTGNSNEWRMRGASSDNQVNLHLIDYVKRGILSRGED